MSSGLLAKFAHTDTDARSFVTAIDPMKRGLKVISVETVRPCLIVTAIDPMKRGLKGYR